MHRFIAQAVDAFTVPRAHRVDALTAATGVLGLLYTLKAVVDWHAHPDTPSAWTSTGVAVALVLLTLTGFVLMARRARLRRLRPFTGRWAPNPAPARLMDVAHAVARAAFDWSGRDRAAYASLHEETIGAAPARSAAVRALNKAGRIDGPMRDLLTRLGDQVGPAAVDVALAALATDLVPYGVWETLTRWWRALELAPALPSPDRPDTGEAAHLPRSW